MFEVVPEKKRHLKARKQEEIERNRIRQVSKEGACDLGITDQETGAFCIARKSSIFFFSNLHC